MPDRRRHRGRHPADEQLFDRAQVAILREAVTDLAWLIGRGYSEVAAVKLVGDRFELRERQRIAIRRSTCSDQARATRQSRRLAVADLRGRELAIDGFNCVVTIEAAMGGGLIMVGRDSSHRDLASVHGSYRKVEETRTVIVHLAECMRDIAPGPTTWYLDRPVSNSGRLRDLLLEIGAEHGLAWQVELVNNPDRELASDPTRAIASSDSWILDRCGPWVDLPGHIISTHLPDTWLIDLQ